jgi:hypothetical protein
MIIGIIGDTGQGMTYLMTAQNLNFIKKDKTIIHSNFNLKFPYKNKPENKK